ncbi:hypothetical protein [Rhodococcus kronopolitis]|uniref:Integral membrane protein n=1 Tax=Rhodococcus kronopolitis TaxID=1460226 RepID=A0ABV9FKP7_9NOCA
MITWIVALICSTAVGARIGRLTVRPPSLARVSIAIAAIAVTLAATIDTDTMIDMLDSTGLGTAETAFTVSWIAFTTATALIAAVSLPRVSAWPQWLLSAAAVGVGLAVTTVELVAAGHSPVTDLYLAAAGLFAVGAGARQIRWNPLGRAIGLFCAGTLVVAAMCLRSLFAGPTRDLALTSGWWSLAIVLISAGCSSVMIESWLRAKTDLRRTFRLWSTLTRAHPELLDTDYRSATAALASSDRISQILDGLYLHAGGGLVTADDSQPPTALSEHADEVAQWLHRSAVAVELFNPAWLSTPDHLGDRDWIVAVATAYNAGPRVSAPAELSDTLPSR